MGAFEFDLSARNCSDHHAGSNICGLRVDGMRKPRSARIRTACDSR